MLKKKRTTLNDGYARIFKEKPIKTDFSAKRNARTLDDYIPVCEAYFGYSSIRQEDLAFADAMGKSLDLKIKVNHSNLIDTSCTARIGDKMFDIYRVDEDRFNKLDYIFMTEARTIEE